MTYVAALRKKVWVLVHALPPLRCTLPNTCSGILRCCSSRVTAQLPGGALEAGRRT